MALADYNHHDKKFKSYDIKFHEHQIRTTVTADPTIVDQWISETYEIHRKQLDQNKILVGLDTEWRFIKPDNATNLSKCSKPKSDQFQVAILQLCTHQNRCLIFQLIHAPISFLAR
ncbi:Ribonuclease H-like domain containing protein [Trema orientale]|uniref:Ribonuclease H-like domain containing protein n=1 Tax=Trema orientale TaxID=63057 RepID=A0A2P5BVA4_TREOI|nr:Ribonuclease H-like domain containing protein [Trema orientale]